VRAPLLLAALAAAIVAATASASARSSCSASGLSTSLPAQKVPAAVASVRARIVRAAVACDYAALERIGREKGSFAFSYGAERSAAAYWRTLERKGGKPLGRLVKILELPVTRNEAKAYAWPSAYTEKPKAADWNALVRAGVYTRREVDRMRAGGNVYLGYRVGITPKGDWQFFIAGD